MNNGVFTEASKNATGFLMCIYGNSISHSATILNAQATYNYDILRGYLMQVRNHVDELIEALNNDNYDREEMQKLQSMGD